MKFAVLLQGVFHEFCLKLSPFALFLFLVKKQVKQLDVPFKKTVTFYETCRSIIRGFPSNSVNSQVCPFFVKKTTKKHDVLCRKSVTFCKNCCFYAGGFASNSVRNLTFALFFGQKQQKDTMHPSKKIVTFCDCHFFLTFCQKSHLLPSFWSKND